MTDPSQTTEWRQYPPGHPANLDRDYENRLRALMTQRRESGATARSLEYLFDQLDGTRIAYRRDLVRAYEQGRDDLAEFLRSEIMK